MKLAFFFLWVAFLIVFLIASRIVKAALDRNVSKSGILNMNEEDEKNPNGLFETMPYDTWLMRSFDGLKLKERSEA